MARAASPLPRADFKFRLPAILDQPPAGWHPLAVVRRQSRKWDWVVLMVDVDPDDLIKPRSYKIEFFYVLPSEPGGIRRVSNVWVRVPGKHRNKEAAWDAVQEMVAVRH